MSISDCISDLGEWLVTVMSSSVVFPFVGFMLAAFILDFIIGFVKRR